MHPVESESAPRFRKFRGDSRAPSWLKISSVLKNTFLGNFEDFSELWVGEPFLSNYWTYFYAVVFALESEKRAELTLTLTLTLTLHSLGYGKWLLPS